MIKTVSLQEAIATIFGFEAKDVPKFTSYKPLKQAREWLDHQKAHYSYQRSSVGVGSVVAFTVGSGNPQYAAVTEEQQLDELKGAQILVSLSPAKSKSQKRRKNVSQGKPVNDGLGPESEAKSDGTVTEPEPRN